MIIREQKLKGKRRDASLCEDALAVTDDYIAVIDGMTSKTARLYGGRTTGRYASEVIASAVSLLPPGISFRQAVERLTEEIRRAYLREGCLPDAEEKRENRFAAGFIGYSRARREIWSLGDCQCMVNGKIFSFEKKADETASAARALYLEAELQQGKTVAELMRRDASREVILPLLKAALAFENAVQDSGFAFGVLDGFPVPEKYLEVVPVQIGDEVVLASDGYPKLFATLQESEEYLQHILREDPLCFRKFRSTKGLAEGNASYDDRAYIRFFVNS